MTGFLSLVVAVVGLVLYFIATNPKVSEAGRICFFSGLFAFLLFNGSQTLALLR